MCIALGNRYLFSPLWHASGVATELAQHFALDQLDEEIIKRLSRDARTPYLSIAAELKVDEKTIRYRVGKMRTAGLLSFQAMLNPNQLERCVVLYLGIRLSAEGKKNPQLAAERVIGLAGVRWCGVVMGGFDLLAEICLESFEQVKDFQLKTLQTLPEIESSETFVVLSHHGNRGIQPLSK